MPSNIRRLQNHLETIILRKSEVLQKHSLHGEKNSLNFIDAVHQW